MDENEVLAAARTVAKCFGHGLRDQDIPGGGKLTRLVCDRGSLSITYVSKDGTEEAVTVEWRGSTVFERHIARGGLLNGVGALQAAAAAGSDSEWAIALASAQSDASRATESAAQKAESDGRRAGGIRGSKLRGAWGLSAADGRQRGGEDPSGPKTGGVVEGRP